MASAELPAMPAEDVEKGPPRRPLGRYGIGLALIALLAIVSTLLVSRALTRQEKDAGVIRSAASQIVLSQRLAQSALDLAGAETADDASMASAQLTAIVNELGVNHRGLRTGDRSLGLPGGNSGEVRELFDTIQPHYQVMVREVQLIRGAAERGLPVPDESVAALVASAELFETGMGSIVHTYESEAEQRVIGLETQEYILLSITLVLLILEALLLFRPAAREAERKWHEREGEHLEERADDQRRLAYLARFDPLTGLINRFLFNDRLDSAIARARRDGGIVALMFLDLDEFKGVNDHYGHATGDELLQQVADRLVESVRESDTVARLGGDEFTVILEGAQRVEDAGHVATKILRALEKPYIVGHRELRVTTSIGIALYPIDGDGAEGLLRDADIAMYSAKAAGRNTYQYFTPELREQTSQRLYLIDGLRQALDADDQLYLVYQPKYDASTRRVIGVEALIRWQHPELGMVGPADFIPLAEDTDLIVPIGTWVLQEAARQLAAWRADELALTVSVNVSSRQIRRGTLVAEVENVVERFGVPASALEIEITEGVLIDDIELARRTIERLRDLGVRVSIDDFGTGYSSLSYLQRFPIDSLKIDQAFVRELDGSDDAVALSSAIIGLARSLRLDVIAEGVESRDQLEMLAELGCSKMQGFLISHPLRPADIPQFVLSGVNEVLPPTIPDTRSVQHPA